jgi:crotonobetainyl-CoA:carnitine CoA-transferase CaiB-like acyl-CoA transferase
MPQPTESAIETARRRQPLEGVRVLDMATVLAAPFAASLCADYGAEVVKLELPDGSDPLRGLAPVKDGMALYWKVTNRGKRGISLDVRKPAGRELLLRMLPSFDVLVENFRSGTMDRWGLDAATLFAANPRLIVLRLTGFGQTGPYRDKPGFARVFEAMGGLAHLAGEADGPPMHMNFPMGDMIAGLFGGLGILAEIARLRGDPDAPGVEIDLSATEALLRVLEPLPVEYEQCGVARARNGNRATYTAPSNMYRSADGVWFTLVASSDPIFARMSQALAMPELAGDARFATNPARVRNSEALDAVLVDWFGARSFAQIEAALQPLGVPFSRVNSIAEVIRDPQVIAREAIVRLADPDLGSVPAPAVVPRVVGRPAPVQRSGPATGEHNAEFYRSLGLSVAEIDAFRSQGVI